MRRPPRGAATPSSSAPSCSRSCRSTQRPSQRPDSQQPSILDRLDFHPELSLGLVGATQGGYDQTQALLDITQGTRVSSAAYKPKEVPVLDLLPARTTRALFQGWLDARARADSAPADIVPGLLAQTIPGGAAYAGVSGRAQLESIAGRRTRPGGSALVSIGKADDVARRAQRLLTQRSFVVAGLPTGEPGDAALEELIKQPHAGRAADGDADAAAGARAAAAADRHPRPRRPPSELTSDSTQLDGIVAGIDLAADHARVARPAACPTD